jgi:hypothetical protein
MSDDESSHPSAQDRRTALDVRAEHRVLLGLSDAELGAMPLLPEGTRLARRHYYLDLHDPARADFTAEGDEVVEPGQHVVARDDLTAELWEELRRSCDTVLGRRRLQGLRPAV